MNIWSRLLLLLIFVGCGVAAAVYLSTAQPLWLGEVSGTTAGRSSDAAPDRQQVASTAADQEDPDGRGGPAAVRLPLTTAAGPIAAEPFLTDDRSPSDGPLSSSAPQPADPQLRLAPAVAAAGTLAPQRGFVRPGPTLDTPRPAVRDQVAVPSREPSLPVSTMMELLEKVLEREKDAGRRPAENPPPPAVAATPGITTSVSVEPASSASDKLVNTGHDRLSLQMKDTDIREVLELLSRGSGRNILATPSVKGMVNASLQDVSFDTALRGILKSTGYVAHREGDIIYVGTREEFETAPARPDKIMTRIYRPNYIRASDLQTLITPLLTPSLGTISVSVPAENGIPADSANAGGDNYADAEVVLVRDYESVLLQIDQVFQDVDVRPLQVAIEAMILSVKLNDSNRLGVNFELLKDRNDVRIISGNPPLSLGQLNFTDGGLKVGILNSSLTFLLDALESVGDTDVIATPRLLVLNKQRAEILIGAELGYVSSTITETATTQSVEFLEVGTQLRIRPFVSSDGLVRMEIHPELSTGSVRVEGGFTLPDKEVTEVTTNIIAYDGSTVIIGGLIRDDLSSNSTQIPLLGSLPGVGPLFRQKVETLDRREILVVITPHIVGDSDLDQEADSAAMEFHHRHAIQFENLSPLAKRRIAQNYFLKAQRAWALGEQQRALKYVNLAIHYNPQSRAAIDLRADIFSGIRLGDHTAGAAYVAPGQLLGPAEEAWLGDPRNPAGPSPLPVPSPNPAQPGSQLKFAPAP